MLKLIMKLLIVIVLLAVGVIIALPRREQGETEDPSAQAIFEPEKCVPALRSIARAQKLWYSVKGQYAQEYSDLCFGELNPDAGVFTGNNLSRNIAIASADKTEFPDGSPRTPLHGAFLRSVPLDAKRFLVVLLPANPSPEHSRDGIRTYALGNRDSEPIRIQISIEEASDLSLLKKACAY